MKKLLIFFTVLSTFVFSAIDEYKTDIYFANGILAEKKAVKGSGDANAIFYLFHDTICIKE
jgi:hypothetical protein